MRIPGTDLAPDLIKRRAHIAHEWELPTFKGMGLRRWGQAGLVGIERPPLKKNRYDPYDFDAWKRKPDLEIYLTWDLFYGRWQIQRAPLEWIPT